jgi:hypothetical protein
MLTYSAQSSAPAERAWELFARPDRWSQWAPHLRGAWGLGSPEVEPGRHGLVRLLGLVPIPATITTKRPGRSWSWRVGTVDMIHRVVPRPDGCEVRVEINAIPPIEAVLRATYGPVIELLLRNLARVSTQDAR